EENDFRLQGYLLELLKDLGNLLQVGGQVAGIDTDGYPWQIGLISRYPLGQRRQQAGGQVVDAVIAVVFQHVERCTFSGTGTTADDEQFHNICCLGGCVAGVAPVAWRVSNYISRFASP